MQSIDLKKYRQCEIKVRRVDKTGLSAKQLSWAWIMLDYNAGPT